MCAKAVKKLESGESMRLGRSGKGGTDRFWPMRTGHSQRQ